MKMQKAPVGALHMAERDRVVTHLFGQDSRGQSRLVSGLCSKGDVTDLLPESIAEAMGISRDAGSLRATPSNLDNGCMDVMGPVEDDENFDLALSLTRERLHGSVTFCVASVLARFELED